MKLFIKQKVGSFKDIFTVKDEAGTDCYFIEGEILTIGKKLHVYNQNRIECFYLQQKVWSFLPRFFVYIDNQQVIEIVKEFSFLKPRYSVLGLDWEVNGNIWSNEYEILSQGQVVVSIKKEFLIWGDTYVLDITDSKSELNALAVALAIDAVMDSTNSAT